jgi:hypothetical protein
MCTSVGAEVYITVSISSQVVYAFKVFRTNPYMEILTCPLSRYFTFRICTFQSTHKFIFDCRLVGHSFEEISDMFHEKFGKKSLTMQCEANLAKRFSDWEKNSKIVIQRLIRHDSIC